MPPQPAPELTLERLHAAVSGNAAAVRIVTKLTPAGWSGDKVFPPTYKHPDRDGATYAFEDRRIEGKEVKAVLLDSVASQANRMEEELREAFYDGTLTLPLLTVTVPRSGGGATRVTSLDAPHRMTDAIFRDSLHENTPFRKSRLGKEITAARLDNAAALFRYCPTALLFGFWDSQAGSGNRGAKVARAVVSEIVGLDAVPGRTTGSRIDPLGITASAATIYRSEQDMWTLDRDDAVHKDDEPVPYGKDGKPSSINHGNVPPTVSRQDAPGGVTISEAVHTTVLSLPQLRRLRFPDPAAGKPDPERDRAGRTVLAALALVAAALVRQRGYQLRSRCLLRAKDTPVLEILGPTASETEPFSLTLESALRLLEAARAQAKGFGLVWEERPVELQPSDKLRRLVRHSDEKVSTEEESEGDSDAGD
jgi:CRISPR-associated protein Csb1